MSNRSRLSVLFVILVMLVCGSLGALFGQRLGSAPPASDDEIRENLRVFTQVYNVVEQNYAEPVIADKAIYNGAIPGMLRVLDPHSNFFDPKSYSLLKEDQRGKYYGVGMQVGPRNNKVIVIAPFVGTPAYRAGIRPGDVIVGVDGKPTDNMSTSEVADLLKGPRGTVVRITILREGTDGPMEFTVTRDEIPRFSVDVHFQIRPGVGYFHISSFNETTEQEVSQALEEFGNLNGLILDLRQNPGGLLSEGVGVAEKFLKKGSLIVKHMGREFSAQKPYRAQEEDSHLNYPIVVLVNRGTASAAEIVAGAIQDHDRGLIVGETTFGKGLVQTVYPLSENTGLALTTAKYYTPSGRLIQRDYSGVSLYDYYYSQNGETNQNGNREIRMTDSGRPVYGGGGITPDVKLPALRTNRFQDSLVQRYAFFNFGRHYLIHRHLPRNFEVDDGVLQEFRKFLDEQKIPYTEGDLMESDTWLRSNIKAELFIAEFGHQEGLRVRAETDPQVVKAVELLPMAKDLADTARKVIAERGQGRAVPQ